MNAEILDQEKTTERKFSNQTKFLVEKLFAQTEKYDLKLKTQMEANNKTIVSLKQDYDSKFKTQTESFDEKLLAQTEKYDTKFKTQTIIVDKKMNDMTKKVNTKTGMGIGLGMWIPKNFVIGIWVSVLTIWGFQPEAPIGAYWRKCQFGEVPFGEL